uniref:Glutamate receptor 4-like isoform X2 n=1 Tax=Diabrotica virgifera virgifera TaxID=50390 RepID=A0A6P7G0D5_DIAVI
MGKIGVNNNSITYTFPPTYQLFLLDLNCSDSKILLQKANQQNLFRPPFTWILWDQDNYQNMQNLYFRIDSKIFTIHKLKDKNIHSIKSFYKLNDHSMEFMEDFLAEWKHGHGFLWYNFLTFRNRSNLIGMDMKISSTASFADENNHLDDLKDTHSDASLKVTSALLKVITEMVNITPVMLYDTGSNKCRGMIDDLENGRAELPGNSLFISLDKIETIDFLVPCCPFSLKFILRAPPLTYVSNLFILPFDQYVWLSCVILLIIMCNMAYLIALWEVHDPVFKEMDHKNQVEQLQPRILDNLIMQIGILTEQGAEAEPKSFSGRITFVFSVIAVMFLFTAYSANIVALLQSTTESTNTIEGLFNSNMDLGVQNNSLIEDMFKLSTDPLAKVAYDKIFTKDKQSKSMSLEEGIARMRNGFFAFQTNPSSAYKEIAKTFEESEKCSLTEVSLFKRRDPYTAIRKGSPYRDIIKIATLVE